MTPKLLLAALLVTLAIPSSAFGQAKASPRGYLAGKGGTGLAPVLQPDATNAIAGVAIQLKQLSDGAVQTAPTDSTGTVVFAGLAGGNYEVSIVPQSQCSKCPTALAENHNSSRSNNKQITGPGGTTLETVNFELVADGPPAPDAPVAVSIGRGGGTITVTAKKAAAAPGAQS